MFDAVWGNDDWFSWYEYFEVYGVEEKIKINLKANDLCIVMTLDGQFGGIWSYSHLECLRNADTIHDWMIEMMKEKDNRRGVWLWHIEDLGKSVAAEYIGELHE